MQFAYMPVAALLGWRKPWGTAAHFTGSVAKVMLSRFDPVGQKRLAGSMAGSYTASIDVEESAEEAFGHVFNGSGGRTGGAALGGLDSPLNSPEKYHQ
jgi:hypothetical protein